MFDDVTSRLLLVVTLLAAATLWYARRRRSDGRFVSTGAAPVARDEHLLTADDLGGALGDRATFVQFSTATCATCPQVRRALTDVASRVPGVAHREVAAEDRMDLVQRFAVRRTPTVLLVGPGGDVWSRAAGPMDTRQALAALRAFEARDPLEAGDALGASRARDAREALRAHGVRTDAHRAVDPHA